MSIFVFAGPTLSADETRAGLDGAVHLPPVSQGDVYCAARERPWGIGIVDGYFERVPAVWHKEILWAMSQGVHVFGCSSMGALRAAELESFGMIGVGAVFEAFRSGELEDDDEVTVVHGSGDDGYRVSSEAMVNIRFTLAEAAAQSVIDATTQRQLLAIGKRLFYPERSYPLMLQLARAEDLPAAELDALAAWLPHHRIDRKKLDALEMLCMMREQRESHPAGKQVEFHFQHTDAWEQVQCGIDRRPLDRQTGSDTFESNAVLVELQLLGQAFVLEHARSTIRAMARELARQEGVGVDEASLARVVEDFRIEHGLLEGRSTQTWLARQGLRLDEFDRHMRDEARVRRINAIFNGELGRNMPEYLRLTGQYAALESRAREKQRLLARHGVDNPGLESLELTAEQLWSWYFGEVLGRESPDDLPGYAKSVGFDNEHELRRTVLRERWYRKLKEIE